MKRFATLVLLAGFGFVAPAWAADPDSLPAIPTTPTLPPSTHGGGISVDVSRGAMPPRGQTGWTLPSNNWRPSQVAASAPAGIPPATPAPSTAAAAMSAPNGPLVLPTGYKLTSTTGAAVAAPVPWAAPAWVAPGCEPASARGSCYEKFKAWFCFRPTTGDALPKLNPHPYIGPIAGTFPCGPAGCATGTCATGACATGATGACDSGRFGGILAARGCKGNCVPPADDAIPGYRFAGSESPRTATPVVQPTGYTTYKPTQATAPSKPVAKPQPTGDPLARPYTRP